MKKFEVYMDTWTSHDRWSGPESAGMSLHLTQEDHQKFVKEEYKNRKNPTPEYYENADDNVTKVFVNEEIYAKIVASKHGIRHYGTIKTRQELE